MSFGVGLMDVVGVTRFAWKVYKALRDSSDDFRRLSGEVASLHTVLLETEDILSENPRLDNIRQRRLSVLTVCCRDTLEDIQRLLDNHESLGTQAMRTWDRLHWGLSDLSDVRMRLIANATNLGAFTTALNNSSISRIDKRLAKFMTEVRAGLREGSVVTASDVSETIDTPGVWEQLQRELEDVGISESVIEENREYIATWFKNTLQDGLAGTDGDATTLYSRSHTLSMDSGRISPTTVPGKMGGKEVNTEVDGAWDAEDAVSDNGSNVEHTPLPQSPSMHRDSGYGGSTRENSVSCMKSAIDRFTEDVERSTGGKRAAESLRELAVEPPKQVSVKKKASPTRLLLKLLQKDDAIIQAASDGDATKVAKLISLGMNVNARDRWGWSALSMCGYGGYTDIARMLLDHGADLDNIDVDGEAPEDLARNRGNREMVLLFEAAREARDKKTREMDTEQPRKVGD